MPFRTGIQGAPGDVRAWEEEGRFIAGRPGQRPRAPGAVTAVFPPVIAPPSDAIDFYREGRTSITGPGVSFVPPGSVLQLPQGAVGVIRELTLNIQNMLAATDVRYTLRFDEAPVPGYDNLTIFPRAAAGVTSNFDANATFIRLPDGVKIDVLLTVIDGGTYLIGAAYRGWFYGKTIQERWDAYAL